MRPLIGRHVNLIHYTKIPYEHYSKNECLSLKIWYTNTKVHKYINIFSVEFEFKYRYMTQQEITLNKYIYIYF